MTEKEALHDWTGWLHDETPYNDHEILLWATHPVKGLNDKKPEDFSWSEFYILKDYVEDRIKDHKPLIDSEDLI